MTLAAFVLCCLCGLWPPRALAQETPDADGADGQTDTTSEQPADNEPAPVESRFAGEVLVELERFGVGNVARLGDWAAIRVRIKDMGTKQRNVLLRLADVDSDGDFPQQQREVATNPGGWQGVWLYTRLSFQDPSRRTLLVTVHVAEPAGDTSLPHEQQVAPGRLLGRLELEPRQSSVLFESVGMYGVVGPPALGLRQYSLRPQGSSQPFALRGHELMEVVTGLTPAELPDRWQGLMNFDVLVWTQGEISELRAERARAVQDWVQRGGHLVVVLPPVGQGWTNPASNELHDIMPSVIVTRRESVDLLAYRPLITARTDGPFPKTGVVHEFERLPQAAASDASIVLNGPNEKCIVVRRLVGAGAVTLIGLDLNQTAFAQFEMIDADIFWHRILGRRGDFSPDSRGQNTGFMGMGERGIFKVDEDIGGAISVAGRSAGAVLAAFALFGVYWVVVGPPGFFMLKRIGWHRHSWGAFLAGAAAFTALAWGGANALRPHSVEATHVTILDHVYGQPVQRARMWASVLIPWYGAARVAVGEPTGERERSLSAVATWESPDSQSAGSGGFPDVRPYPIDTRTPDAFTAPVRATIKQVRADWCDSPVWRMPRPTGPDGTGAGELTIDPRFQSGRAGPFVVGTLVHELPAALQDTTVYILRGQTIVNGNATDQLLADGQVFDQGTWEPGTPLILETVQATRDNAVRILLMQFINDLVPSAVPGDFTGTMTAAGRGIRRNLTAATWMGQLKPPERKAGTTFGTSVPTAAQQRLTHGLDLSRWLTQPCVIVTGFIGDTGERSPAPVPLFVDGREVPLKGLTMVRWVYPLGDRPPKVGEAADQKGRTNRSGAKPEEPPQEPENSDEEAPQEDGGP